MGLDRLLAELEWAGNEELRNVLTAEWESSQGCFPSDAPSFLLPESVADACQVLSLPADARAALLSVAGKTVGDSRLCTLAWHLHYCAFRSTTYPSWGPIGDWPSVEALDGVLEGNGRTFYLLILTSGLPGMQAIYETRGIPYDVLQDTLSQLRDELADLHETHNVWGLSAPHRVEWYRFLLRGDLFRLGRLSFHFGLFRWPVRVFRHQASRAVLALAEGGLSLLPSGQANGPGRADTTGEWTSEFSGDDDGVTGHPVLPTGRVLRRTIHLPTAEWQQVLARDDPALYVHIPESGPLAHDLCRESFEAAAEFFARHFPERPYVCFCGDSWVLNSQLQELLPPASNMVRFQREMYLLPHQTYDPQLADVILGGMPEDLSKASRNTSLQRALVDFLAGGGRLHASAGAGFILPQDFRWGEQVYLRQKLPWIYGQACP